MNKRDYQSHLREIIDQLEDAALHLRASWERCTLIDPHINEENALIEFEALTSRFARLIDFLINKVYRSIDAVEFISDGTLIDVLNRADKRKLIDSIQEMRILKDLRNDIAHEYLPERIQLLHLEVLDLAPKLLGLVDRAVEYCQKYRG